MCRRNCGVDGTVPLASPESGRLEADPRGERGRQSPVASSFAAFPSPALSPVRLEKGRADENCPSSEAGPGFRGVPATPPPLPRGFVFHTGS